MTMRVVCAGEGSGQERRPQVGVQPAAHRKMTLDRILGRERLRLTLEP